MRPNRATVRPVVTNATLEAAGREDSEFRATLMVRNSEGLTITDHSPLTTRHSRARKRPWRYRWPDDIRHEALARLLKLNAERAQEEKLAGMAAATAGPKRGKGGKSRPASSAAPAQGELLPPPQTDLFSR